MRICHITSMHDWDDDRIYQRACLGLAQKGHEVHLVATMPQEDLPLQEKINFHWLRYRQGWKRRWKSSREAIRKAIDVNADIYHFHDPDLLPHIKLLKKKTPGAKVFYDIHENYAGRFSQWGLPGWLGKLFRVYELGIINKLDGITVVSESMKKLFRKTATPAIVTRNSTDLSRLQNLDLGAVKTFNPPVIYTSGTNSHARNCLQSVQALKYVDDNLEYRMMFVGLFQDGIEKELEAQASKDQTISRLKLEGMLPWEENFLRTARAYCGCVFYEDNPNNQVGIPNRLFEYMYCGLPVLASDFPELKRIVNSTQCGIVVDSDDPKSIAKGIEFLLKKPQEARKMGERGRRAVEEEYGYHVDIERLEDLYKESLRSS